MPWRQYLKLSSRWDIRGKMEPENLAICSCLLYSFILFMKNTQSSSVQLRIISFCLFLSVSLAQSLYSTRSLCLFLSLSLCLALSPGLALSVSLSHYILLSLSVFLSLCLFLSLSLLKEDFKLYYCTVTLYSVIFSAL